MHCLGFNKKKKIPDNQEKTTKERKRVNKNKFKMIQILENFISVVNILKKIKVSPTIQK